MTSTIALSAIAFIFFFYIPYLIYKKSVHSSIRLSNFPDNDFFHNTDYIWRSLLVLILVIFGTSPFMQLNKDLVVGILTDSKQSNVYWHLRELISISFDKDFFNYDSALTGSFLILLYFSNFLVAKISYKCGLFKFLRIDLSKISPWENFRQLKDKNIIRVDMRLKNGILYSGIFADYYWDTKEEKIDLIRIEEPKMRPSSEKDIWIAIPSSRFFINLQEVASINFRILSPNTDTSVFAYSYEYSLENFKKDYEETPADQAPPEDITKEETPVTPAPTNTDGVTPEEDPQSQPPPEDNKKKD